MSSEDMFTVARNLVTTNPVFSEALQMLDSGTEVQLNLDGREPTALYFDGDSAQLEKREAKSPDVEFIVYPEALRVLGSTQDQTMGQFGISVLKQIVSGGVRVRVCGSFFNILSAGYLKIVKEAGPEFKDYLAQHGLSSISKVTSFIRKMRKN